jgi:hypothetical protein
MLPNMDTFPLTLTAAEGDHLLRLVAIGQLAVAEHQRSGWLPARSLEATQLSEHVRALPTAAPIDRPLQALKVWVQGHRKK